MPKQRAEGAQAREVERLLRRFPELGHLRVRRRGDLLTLESGPRRDPIRHARFRRDTVHLWRLEMATHTGRWQKTPFRDRLEALLELLVSAFPWTLAALENPDRT